MNIKTFSQSTGLTPRAIRLYQEKGILKSQRDPDSKYRIFDQEQIQVAKKINAFRKIGFSIDDIAAMLKVSPELSTDRVKRNIKSNLEKLKKDLVGIEKQILENESLLNAAAANEPLTARQRFIFKNMAFNDLSRWSLAYVEDCLSRKKLGVDEELQMVSCAHADLVMKAVTTGTTNKDFANAHHLIARCLEKIRESRLAKRHEKLAVAYENLHNDPNWVSPRS